MATCEICGSAGPLRGTTFFAYDPDLKAQRKRGVKLCAECAGRMEIEPAGGASE